MHHEMENDQNNDTTSDVNRASAPRATPSILVEACCDSLATAQAAQAFGAHRIELCGDGDGGTTPLSKLISECRAALSIPMHVMIRPHTSGFQYSETDVAVMLESITDAKTRGADGIVVGPLKADNTVHQEQLGLFVRAARPMQVAFHRAFDQTPNATDALETLLRCGVNLVLTSGHQRLALDGAGELRALQRLAGNRMVILAGGGVRGQNVVQLVTASGVQQVHARATDPLIVRDVIGALTAAS